MDLSEASADVFAHEWLAAWNSRDPERIVAHYREDVEYHSPFAARLGSDTPVVGRDALRRYVTSGLDRYPRLQLGPDLLVAVGAGSIAISYRSVDELLAIETLALDDDGLITEARCHYRRAPTD